MMRQIFSAWASAKEPPKTVKSCEKTYTSRPFTVPYPVTTPSPKKCFLSNPKLVDRCFTSMPISSKLPGSKQQVHPLAGGQLPLGVLGLHARFASTLPGLILHRLNSLERVLMCVCVLKLLP